MSNWLKNLAAEHPELSIFILTVVFSAGAAWAANTALASRVATLEEHDGKNGIALARIQQRVEDIAEGLGIPKRHERIPNADQ